MSNTAQSKQGKNPAASPDAKTAESGQKAVYSAKDAARMPAWTSAWGDRPPVSLTDPLADLQAKNVVNQPGDAYEQEADDVADQVMQRDTSGTLGVSPLIATSLSHVSSMIQRAPLDEQDTATSATTEASTSTSDTAATESAPTSDTTTAGAAPESTAADVTSTPGLIVEDEADQPGPGQMKKSDFLAQLKDAVCATTEEALKGTIWSAAGCPWVDHWFGYYSNRDSQQVERAIRRYAPETVTVTSAGDYIPLICERVRRAIAQWSTTGEITGVPEGVSRDTSGTSTGTSAASADVGTGETSPSTSGADTSSSSETVSFKGREGGARETSNPQAIQSQLGTGRSLDSGVKSQMESAFSVDFSQVRVHTDSRAAGLSNDLNARAFTVGEHVAFGPGEYQPGTLIGNALIAHELAHVVQQGGASASEPMQKGGAEYNSLEEDADVSAVGAVVSMWGGSKGMLTNIAQNAMPAMRSGLRLQRCASTQKRPVTPSGGQSTTAPVADQFQQAVADPSGNVLSEAIPVGEQQRLRVITAAVNIADIDDLFSTRGATTNIPLPQGVTIRFAATIPNTLHRGLQNVAGELSQRMNPPPLEVNSTINLALDLRNYGGDNAAFRFTYVEHRPRGRRSTREILVERLGSIGTDKMQPSQIEVNRRKFQQHGFRRIEPWSESEFQSVLAAISQIPDSMLSPVDGIAFRRDRVSPTDPNAGGDYDPKTHTITLYDRGFIVSMTRVGIPGSGFANESVRSVIHEIGHAIDLLPLRQTWSQLEQAEKALQDAFRQFENPPGSRQYRFPSSEQASYDALQARINTATQAENQARSASGYRWQTNRAGEKEIVQGGAGAGQNEFRGAATQDGGIRITHYSDKEWQEYFAESFSIYIADPDSLRRLRPHVYQYFVRKYPR